MLLMRPESSHKRILSIDVVRGIAIFGILLVNGPALNGPAYKDSHTFAFQNTVADIWYSQIIYSFANNNFYPIFACLFGLSAAIYMANKPESRAKQLFTKRMCWLLLIGILHACFVWWGDILVVYALLGFSLVTLYKRSASEILTYLIVVILVAILLSISFYYINDHPPYPPTAQALLTYSQGNFLEITYQRIHDYLGSYFPGYLYGFTLLQMIDFLMFYCQLIMCLLFGYWFFVSGWLYRLSKDYDLAKRTALITFTLTFVVAIIAESFPLAAEALFVVKGFLRGVFYASTILFLCHHDWWVKVLYPFSLIGRMSLSNYIFHNLLLSLIFYGYGLGLYGQIGPFAEAPILLGLMVCSVFFSSLWLKYFNWGPLEWLWRTATQGEFSAMRRT